MALRYSCDVIGGRRRMLLVLTLVLGVLGMHALVLVGSSIAATGSHPSGPALVVATSNAVQLMTGHDVAGSAATEAGHSDRSGGHGSTPSLLHHAMHLCLAILAALLVVGAVALVLWRTLSPDRGDVPVGARVRRPPRRLTPPTSVRLAQLGVLRN